MEYSVLVLIPVTQQHKVLLQQALPGSCFTYLSANEVTSEQVAKADIILGNPPVQFLTQDIRLKWLQLFSAGTAPYSEPGVLPEDVILTNATGAYGLAIGEHMTAMILSLYKNLHLYRDNQRRHSWADRGSVRSIYGSTVLAVGLGDIGGEFAKRMKALGAYTIGVRRKGTVKPNYLDELVHLDQLDEMLPRADIVALSLPGTAETYHILNQQRISKMKPGAVLINVGRGNAVDTPSLVASLKSGLLSGACLEVTDPEPLPSDSPLWEMENVIITPHVSGGFHLKETHTRMISIFSENLRRFAAGEPLNNQVDFSTGYRKLVE